MTFDDLWEQEERQGLQRRLQREYPVWQRQHKRRRTAAAPPLTTAAMVALMAQPTGIMPFQRSLR